MVNEKKPVIRHPHSRMSEMANQLNRVKSTELFGNSRMLIILHGGEEYRLNITNNDKLILTK